MPRIKRCSLKISLWPLPNSSVSLSYFPHTTQPTPELGVDRDDTGFAKLVNKAAKEGKPLDQVSRPSGGCPFAGTLNREKAKL